MGCLVGAAIPDLAGSPALSARVFLLGSTSLTIRTEAGIVSNGNVLELLYIHPPVSLDIEGGGSLETGFVRTLLSDSVISKRGFPGDGIRLGGRICDFRNICV